jgi:hypothetical protein
MAIVSPVGLSAREKMSEWLCGVVSGGVMRTLAAAAIWAVVTAASGPAQAAGEFGHEGWRGAPVLVDGKFRQCQMWMAAINNWDLILSVEHSGELRLGLRNQDLDMTWRVILNERQAVRLQLDDGPVMIKAFKSVSPKQMSTTLSDTDWGKRLRGAKILRINAGQVRVFHLRGIKEAMGMMDMCVKKNAA